MSGHSVQREPNIKTKLPGRTYPAPGEFAVVEPAGVRLRVTIMLDAEDQTPAELDRILAEVRKTIDAYIEARSR